MSTAQNADAASILVVDDNPLIVNVLKSLLQSENYQVFPSSNGKEALDVLAQKNVDVIICDVMMPKMDGYELHKQVRNKAELSHIPFLFLTALGDESEVLHGKETGADDYVVKPFDPRNLLALVKGKIQRSKSLKNLSEEKYDAYRKKVIHTLSHEFRTPLVAINTGTELLIDQKQALDTNKIKNLLEAIRRGGQRLERLVNDFMLLQQFEAGVSKRVFESRAKVASVNDVVKSFIENHLEAIEKAGFAFELKEIEPDLKAKLYEAQILDVLDRLLSNALKFASVRQELEVVVYAESDEVRVELRDRGIGINVEKIKEAIDVFGQINRDKLEQQGGGLGLAIANRYAALHGGRIDFDNRPDGGSIVSLILPRVRES